MRAHAGKQRQRRRMKELGEVGLAPYFRLRRTDDKRWFLQDWRMSQGTESSKETYRLMDMAREGRA